MSKKKPLEAEEYRTLARKTMLPWNENSDITREYRLALHDAARAQEKLDALQKYLDRCAIMREEPRKQKIKDILDGDISV